jgi:phosphoribosylformimino-5-aminoimidazole carboxamide ribotide isomerase
MKFRPCIDLRHGKVVQIVGGTLNDSKTKATKVNFESEHPPKHYSEMYRSDDLKGGHVIALGPNNTDAALEALQAWPGGMQYGGGVNLENCKFWIEQGASHVIVTSAIFSNGQIHWEQLRAIEKAIGKQRLVLDLSCRKKNGQYYIVTDRWQKFTDVFISEDNLNKLSAYCSEFLVHGADVEGLKAGMEEELIISLGKWSPIPVTYAGGAKNLDDFEKVKSLANGRVDLTIGSALDIFGGETPYRHVVDWHHGQSR